MNSHKLWFPILATVLFLARLLCCPRAVHLRFHFRNCQGRLGRRYRGCGGYADQHRHGCKREFTTDQNGLYSFLNVNPGEYSVDVDKTGFKRFKRDIR